MAPWVVWAPGASVPCGGGAGAPPFAGPGLIARVGPVRRRRRVLGGFAWCCLVLGGGGGPLSSMDLPHRGVVAAAAGGMGRVTVLGGVGPGGLLRRGRGGREDTVPCKGEVAGTGGLAPGGGWGMRVERSVAAIPFAGAVRARGVVTRWGRVVGSGSGGGGVGSGGGGAAGGGGVGSGGVGVAGMVLGPPFFFFLRHGGPPPKALHQSGLTMGKMSVHGEPKFLDPWLVFRSPLWGWGVGHRGQPLGLHYVVGRGGGSGAGLDGDGGRGVPRPWVGLAGGGGGLWGMDDGALGDGDVDKGLNGVVLGGRLCGGGGCRWEGGVGGGGWGVLAWVRVRVGAVSVGFVLLRLWCCVCSRGRRLRFGVEFGVGIRFQVEEDLCPEV